MPHVDQKEFTLDELWLYCQWLTDESVALDAHNKALVAEDLPPNVGAIMELTAVVDMVDATLKTIPIAEWDGDDPLGPRWPTGPQFYKTSRMHPMCAHWGTH